MKKKQLKKVTLPKNNLAVFKAIADGLYDAEIRDSRRSNPPPEEKDEFVNDVVQELGKEAFLYSFTPSGEIGDGNNSRTKGNPNTPRVADSFYDGFRDLLGVKGEGSATDGDITRMLSQNTKSPRVVKTRMIRYKGAIINLVQLYLESTLSLTSTDKDTYEAKRAGRSSRAKDGKEYNKENQYKGGGGRLRTTAFNYKKRPQGMTDGEWFSYLITVEENRYMRMFIAVIFFKTISELFLISSTDVFRAIKAQNLLGTEGLSLDAKFTKMRRPSTRTKFVDLVRELWRIKLQPLPKAKKGKDDKTIKMAVTKRTNISKDDGDDEDEG